MNQRATAPYGGINLGETSSFIFACVANTTDTYVTGSCPVIASSPIGAWHHWIISYAAAGTASGQGGPVKIYLDDVLKLTVSDAPTNNPVFNSGISDTLIVGSNGALMDDLRVYDRNFTPAEQCARIIDGTWNGSSCTLP